MIFTVPLTHVVPEPEAAWFHMDPGNGTCVPSNRVKDNTNVRMLRSSGVILYLLMILLVSFEANIINAGYHICF